MVDLFTSDEGFQIGKALAQQWNWAELIFKYGWTKFLTNTRTALVLDHNANACVVNCGKHWYNVTALVSADVYSQKLMVFHVNSEVKTIADACLYLVNSHHRMQFEKHRAQYLADECPGRMSFEYLSSGLIFQALPPIERD